MPFGPVELILILVVAFLLFGARKLPEMGRGLGEGLRELRQAGRELTRSTDQPSPPRRED